MKTSTSHEVFSKALKHHLQPVISFIEDDDVSEIMINGHREVYVEKHGQVVETESSFSSRSQLLSAVKNIAQFVDRRINEDEPMMDARLPDGSRVHAVIPPVSQDGICLAIRKFPNTIPSLEQLVQWDTLTEQAREFLEISVKLSKNIMISGGTSTGKTTMLNALSSCIRDDERIIVIEDSSELQLPQDHVIQLESQPGDNEEGEDVTIRDLFQSSLRLRPDRIVIGEVRGKEAMDLVQSMISGHKGSISTVHATTPMDAMNRLETLSLMSEVNMPLQALRGQIASAIDLVVQLVRFEEGARKVTHISEANGLDEEGRYELDPIFLLHRGKSDRPLQCTDTEPSFTDEIVTQGLEHEINRTEPVFNQKNE